MKGRRDRGGADLPVGLRARHADRTMTAPARPPLRVSLDVSAVPAHPVGAGRYTVELVSALVQRRDLQVVLICRRGDGRRWHERAPSAAAVVAAAPDRRPSRLAWEQVVLPSLLRHLRVDVHHGPHYTMPERAAVPTVVTIHDLTFFDHPEWHERVKVPVFRRAITVAARRAAAIVCVSEATARALRRLRPPRGELFVAPHGVDHDRFRPRERAGAADVAAVAALGVRPPYVLFLGTIEPRKAVPELVAAFDQVADERADLTLVVAGGAGWGAEAVEAALHRARHHERVVRIGYVPDEAVPALLRAAEVVAYPALEEGFGLPALEALACGAPLVTSSGTVMADMAGGAALVAPPGSVPELAGALRRALRGGPEAEERRRLGLEIAAGFTWAASADRHVEAYRAAASP